MKCPLCHHEQDASRLLAEHVWVHLPFDHEHFRTCWCGFSCGDHSDIRILAHLLGLLQTGQLLDHIGIAALTQER